MPASNTTLTANFEPVPVTDSATLSELFREGVSVEYEGKSCPGVRQLVLGVYNVELDMEKVKGAFEEIEGHELVLTIEGKRVKGKAVKAKSTLSLSKMSMQCYQFKGVSG